jgi:cytochrome c oxidase subunit III
VSGAAIHSRTAAPRPDPLREPWSEVARQQEAATFGMWLFLMSEMLFFGAVFMAFSFTRALNVSPFQEAARDTEIAYGASNTVVLVTSSLTITLAVRAAGLANRRLAARLLAATAVLGIAFLVIKGFEYRSDLEHHLYPAADFALGQTAAEIFWAFYWIMTGIHAIHLAVGVGLVSRLTWLVRQGRLSLASPQLEVTSLYWHLVDAFWLVLFPVLYIAGRG